MSEVNLSQVTVCYNDIKALKEFNLKIKEGEFIALLGPSGCGKTTCLRTVAGFIIPDQGNIFFNGERVTDTPPFKRKVGIVFQNYALFPHKSIFENVAFGLRMMKMKREEQPRPIQTPPMDRQAMMRQFMERSRPSTQTQSSSHDEKWLKWIDEKNNGKGFVKWTKFTHTQLGEVEIGGFEPYLRINPSSDQIPELNKTHAEFVLYLASQFAEIMMDVPEVRKMSSDLFELKIKIHNKGKFPYATAMGQRTRNINSIMLTWKFEDNQKMTLFGGNKRTDTPSLEAGAEKEFKWIILSPPGKKIEATLWASNGGGTSKKTIVLK